MKDRPRVDAGADVAEVGALLEAFFKRVAHPRGLALEFLNEASLTLPQVILLHRAILEPGSTPSTLAASLKMSLPSVSQMIERLVKLRLARRIENPDDRRQKTVEVTPKARTLLAQLKKVRSAELANGVAHLTPRTQQKLAEALTLALDELDAAAVDPSDNLCADPRAS